MRAWCDPDCPPGQTPYVWRFPKNGGAPRNKSPEKLFHQTDMYTVRTEDGERDLTLETNLSRLEGEFTKLRRHGRPGSEVSWGRGKLTGGSFEGRFSVGGGEGMGCWD